MSNLASALKDEVARLVRKEVERELAGLRKEIDGLRRAVAKGVAPPPARRRSGAVRGGRSSFTPESIRSHRHRLGLSQKELAALTGVTPVAVYFWESGRTTPRGKSVDALNEVRKMGVRAARERVDKLLENEG
ncbi:MAG: helix-turn-helix domain-containing protein [Acidobacteriota bacterium]